MPKRHEFETEEAFTAALRDWFAGQSIGGAIHLAITAMAAGAREGCGGPDWAERIAVAAYEFSDALLAARASGGQV